uniref:Ribosomal RNA methyltransferase FtsJ domain-containing protein n=1 Tax=viral metagenome TaxID=1070528 RepID=A0A6C0F6Y1_9ZZZZ
MIFVLRADASDNKQLCENTFKTLSERLSKVKGSIDRYVSQWEQAKKQIHVYEYVYTSSYRPLNLCNVSPVSRSYFKMKDLLYDFKPDISSCVCLAEAPGGFLQCLEEAGARKLIGVTLVSSDKRVPYWNPKISKSPIFHEIRGIQQNGDLLHFENVLSIINSIGIHSVPLVTGDGGFDTTGDYNRQEELSYPLILSEVLIALKIQRLGGTFICKLFDTFLPSTLQLMDILTRCYDHVCCYKPCMSRISNSEKYIVCQGYKGTPTKLMNMLIHQLFHKIQITHWNTSSCFLESVSVYNQTYVDSQCESIQKGVQLIKDKKIKRKATLEQISKGKEWCRKHQFTNTNTNI